MRSCEVGLPFSHVAGAQGAGGRGVTAGLLTPALVPGAGVGGKKKKIHENDLIVGKEVKNAPPSHNGK